MIFVVVFYCNSDFMRAGSPLPDFKNVDNTPFGK